MVFRGRSGVAEPNLYQLTKAIHFSQLVIEALEVNKKPQVASCEAKIHHWTLLMPLGGCSGVEKPNLYQLTKVIHFSQLVIEALLSE